MSLKRLTLLPLCAAHTHAKVAVKGLTGRYTFQFHNYEQWKKIFHLPLNEPILTQHSNKIICSCLAPEQTFEGGFHIQVPGARVRAVTPGTKRVRVCLRSWGGL